MWNNFFVPHDDEARVGQAGGGQGGGLAALKGSRTQRRNQKMSDSQDGKIKLAFLVCAVGVTLTVLGVGTEFWVELAQPKNFGGNQTCQMAHYGLWKACVRTLWVADVDPERASCGPAELPGESNCTYFKFFTSGENAVVFKKTTSKNLNLAAAVLALLSLTMMVTGSICIIMTLSKGVSFFLKPASFCFIFSGVLVLISIAMFHQSVLALLASDHTVPLHHQLSWSAACVGAAGAILIVGGLFFIILSNPVSSWQKCLPQKNSAT
ncbi:voltage-dependent calcium channel gamma-6 subunit [Corythoichthys intestinalis]|uniref:voltage-dependent calcium channel gamma-6 subunit n=1 Tax=Corythoichthys intestinalis TaxID=161448 RepID=UPI0025A648E9|nr:voltage-dependent calcium channel gamma-6 subunit [Corythoichthys intestinalis]XP_057689153.1 voltage-dependent calcium channel gamma-6 subunit [Corythoichthys intestinalis]XP_061789971.1 voltage-dependent calcium channel gamma-6 subunit [Nerophis lumbriciformis]